MGRIALRNTIDLGICPDCGGDHLLRGPTSSIYLRRFDDAVTRIAYCDWTCGDCQMGFHVTDTSVVRLGIITARAAFYNRNSPEKMCTREACSKPFHGPGVYCCIGCAIEDA